MKNDKSNESNEEFEMLDLEDDKTSFEETEMLDFNADIKVANEIDEMLDFTITEENGGADLRKDTLNALLDNTKDENKTEIDAKEEKLDEFKPSIRDFNIKSAKVKKIVKKSMLYVIILMLFGFEFFITKTGDALNTLRVYASDNQPIKVSQNGKYGFIDQSGNVLVNPKYVYADDFIKGYAIVKDSSNLPLVINKGGKEVISTGSYFSLYRASNDIVASKATKGGLKYGILDSNLKQKTSFEYDAIYYLGDVYSFVKKNTVGLLNLDGKDIFEYKLTDADDKVINVSASKVSDDESSVYGVVMVNKTSQIINLETGKAVSYPTLNEIVAEDNNVFYEIAGGLRRYMYVQDDKVLLESDSYKTLSMDSISSGVLKGITERYEYEYISVKSLEQLKEKLNTNNVREGDKVFIYEERNYAKNTNSVILVKNGEKVKTLDGDFSVYEGFENGCAILKYGDGTFGYINEEGEFINDERYTEASSFDEYGDAIAKKNEGYGVVNKSGKTVIDYVNKDIRMPSGKVKKMTSTYSNNVFYAVKKENKFALYDSKGKRINKKFYNDVVFDNEYPLFKTATDEYDLIVTLPKMSEIKLTSFNAEYAAHDNYVIIKDEYYNYDGKLIYKHGGE